MELPSSFASGYEAPQEAGCKGPGEKVFFPILLVIRLNAEQLEVSHD